jgi:hypothetical protein
MNKLLVLIGTSIGGSAGWWLGAHVGFMTAFMLSVVGTGVSLYYTRRFIRDYMP